MGAVIYLLLVGILQTISLIVIFQQLSQIKLTIMEKLALLVDMFVAYFCIGNGVVLTFIPLLYYFCFRHRLSSKVHLAFFYCIYSVTFFSLVGNLLTSIVALLLDNNSVSLLLVMPLPILMNILVLKIFQPDFAFLRNNYYQVKKSFLVGINVLILLICITQVGSYLWEKRTGGIGVLRYVITVLFILIIIVLMYYLNLKIRLLNKQQVEMLREQQLLQLSQYTKQVEDLYNEIRGIRHDFVNIIKSFGSAIQTNNMEHVEKIYNSTLRKLGGELQENKYDLINLSRVNVSSVKSILSTKFIEALQKKIEIKLEVVEPLDELYIEELDYIRILSIFLDNAIEESEKLKNPEITIAIIVDAKIEQQELIIENRTDGRKINLNLIYKKGYSSKSKQGGLGLSNVREILRKYDNVDISTEYEQGIFTQKLAIRKV